VVLRTRLWSSAKVTSRHQCSRFSIPPVAPHRFGKGLYFRRQTAEVIYDFLAFLTVYQAFSNHQANAAQVFPLFQGVSTPQE